MCEYCKGKNILTIDGYLAIYINNQNKLKAITTNGEFGEDINYCPMCRKEAGKVNKEEKTLLNERWFDLENLIFQIEEHSKSRGLSDEYLKAHEHNTREDIGIGEYAYGIILVPEEWVLPYLKELRNIWEEELNKEEYYDK